MIKSIAMLAFSALTATNTDAASFDCEKAAAPDEKAICANRDLNDADVKMSTMFDMEVELIAMGARDALRGTQKVWLEKRSACKADVDCLKDVYDQRLSDLHKVFTDFISQSPH
jgi:uncharacterized protein